MTKSQYRKIAKSAKYVWGAGAVVVAVGEYLGAFDDEEGGTISEWFWNLDLKIQFVIVFMFGMVFCHFIAWGRGKQTTVNIENLNVEKDNEL